MMLESWMEIAPDSDFTLQNIPFGICSTTNTIRARVCTAIGSIALDLSLLAEAGLFDDISSNNNNFNAVHAFSSNTLNTFMSYNKSIWVDVRMRIQDLLSKEGCDLLRNNKELVKGALIPLGEVVMHLPADIGDYTDFYSSKEHATNVGTIIRGKANALQPNWLHLPVGYHGRSSSIYVSGADIPRPCGQVQKDKNDPNQGSDLKPSGSLDYELEVAFFFGGSVGGTRYSIEEAEAHIFGFVLMNDWSARDLQKWEYVPLGPFTSKNFATTISPWVITPMALEPFVCPTSSITQKPVPLQYLQDPKYSSYDIQLEVKLQGEGMSSPETIAVSNYRHMYWNARQQLVHHSVSGCYMKPGDLLASGTISGSKPSSLGCLLEASVAATKDVPIGNSGQLRKFLKDGDTVIFQGYCHKEGVDRVGFGSCVGKIVPPTPNSKLPVPITPNIKLHEPRFTDFKLYSFWKSSCAWRVRIGLQAKQIQYQTIPVHIFKGEHLQQEFITKNPMKQVPTLECIDTHSNNNKIIQISQSLTILKFLDQIFPHKPLVYTSCRNDDPLLDVAIHQIAEMINSGTQPLQNRILLQKLQTDSNGLIDTNVFASDVIIKGFKAIHSLISINQEKFGGPYAAGTFGPSLADFCLIPQVFNARSYGINVNTLFPEIAKVEKICENHAWFIPAHPDKQIDAEV